MVILLVLEFNKVNKNLSKHNTDIKKTINQNFDKNIKKKKILFNEIAKIDDNAEIRTLELKNEKSNSKFSNQSNIKKILFKAKKNLDLEDLKEMVMDRIIEFKNSKGFLTKDFDTNKTINKISKVKYDLYNYRNNKNK